MLPVLLPVASLSCCSISDLVLVSACVFTVLSSSACVWRCCSVLRCHLSTLLCLLWSLGLFAGSRCSVFGLDSVLAVSACVRFLRPSEAGTRRRKEKHHGWSLLSLFCRPFSGIVVHTPFLLMCHISVLLHCHIVVLLPPDYVLSRLK